VDETYIKVAGHWCYLYRAIDRDGNLVDCMLSRKRDGKTAKCFFKGAVEVVGHKPDRVTTDGYDVYPRAVAEELGEEVCHRTNRYLNNRLEQNHRGIKQRYYCMRGFKCFQAASQFCQAFDELRNYLRPRQRMKQAISLAEQRRVHLERMENLQGMLQAA
jgi:transposase-like protein